MLLRGDEAHLRGAAELFGANRRALEEQDTDPREQNLQVAPDGPRGLRLTQSELVPWDSAAAANAGLSYTGCDPEARGAANLLRKAAQQAAEGEQEAEQKASSKQELLLKQGQAKALENKVTLYRT